MTLPNETIGTGACPRCPDCGVMPRLDVYRSGAGYYVGTWCRCGPYSRESGYYPTEGDARRALTQGRYGRSPPGPQSRPGRARSGPRSAPGGLAEHCRSRETLARWRATRR